MSEISPATDAPAEGEKPGAGAESGIANSADASNREARGAPASPTETGRKPNAAGGGEDPAEKRPPIAAGGSYTPGDGAQPAAQHGGREGGEQPVVHPPDGVGYAFDSSKTDTKVLGERLSSLPDNVQDALKQGGENVKVGITARASSVGETPYNQQLSNARGQDMAEAMREMGVKADINVTPIGESQAVGAGDPKGVDNPVDRVATFKVEFEQRAPQAVAAGDTTPAAGDGLKTAEREGTSAAEKKLERSVEISLQAKGGVADPGRESKVEVDGTAPVAEEEFDATASVSGKAGDLSGEAKAGAWGKGEAGFKVGDKGVGVYGEAESTVGGQAKAQLDLGEYFTDPRSSPRYIDKLFQSVTYSGFTGASIFKWQEGGSERQAGVPLVDLEQDDTKSFLPILDIYDSRAEALKVVQSYPTKGFKVYTFYRATGDVIMPTIFSIHSTPEFHKLWPGLKQGLGEQAADIRAALGPVANTINPLPGTKVDEYGNLSLSGNPLDWLALLKLLRLIKIKEAGPITRKLHSGYGVPYTVLGPHDKLSGTSVYVLKDAPGTVLYVGKGDALTRLREHIKDPKKTQWFGEIAHVEVWGTGLNNTKALALEEDLIGQLKPLHNVDKNPFYTEFGNTMDVGPNLPPAQKVLKFSLEWGH